MNHHFQGEENQIKELLSTCGPVWTTCPNYLATSDANKEEQVRKRMEIARICKEQYGMK